MKKRIGGILLTVMMIFLGGCAGRGVQDTEDASVSRADESRTEGTREYRGFVLDNVLHSADDGDIHYHLYVPDTYDGSEPYGIFFTLPGYEGLYFQGVGENLYSENFGFAVQEYNPKMLVVAPQLSDWGRRRQTRRSPSRNTSWITTISTRIMYTRKGTPAAVRRCPS